MNDLYVDYVGRLLGKNARLRVKTWHFYVFFWHLRKTFPFAGAGRLVMIVQTISDEFFSWETLAHTSVTVSSLHPCMGKWKITIKPVRMRANVS